MNLFRNSGGKGILFCVFFKYIQKVHNSRKSLKNFLQLNTIVSQREDEQQNISSTCSPHPRDRCRQGKTHAAFQHQRLVLAAFIFNKNGIIQIPSFVFGLVPPMIQLLHSCFSCSSLTLIAVECSMR